MPGIHSWTGLCKRCGRVLEKRSELRTELLWILSGLAVLYLKESSRGHLELQIPWLAAMSQVPDTGLLMGLANLVFVLLFPCLQMFDKGRG